MPLLDHAAGDPTAGVTCRIGLVVILAGMNHQRRAVGVEHRIWLALVEGNVSVDDFDPQLAACRNVQVRHVTGMMSVHGHHAMLLVGWIEMPARAGERRLAFADSMDVKGMFARGDPLD